jgi:hypothetical protein
MRYEGLLSLALAGIPLKLTGSVCIQLNYKPCEIFCLLWSCCTTRVKRLPSPLYPEETLNPSAPGPPTEKEMHIFLKDLDFSGTVGNLRREG